MNYSDISKDIYYSDDFSYLKQDDNNKKTNLDVQVLCSVDTLYNEAMRNDSEKYKQEQIENKKKNEENINKMFLHNKNYYSELMDQYKQDVIISLPQKNIDILNSIYRTKYDVGILNNVQFGENVTCNEEQLKAIRNCSTSCSRNECNYENLSVILGNCRINGIPQSYGETFCMNENNNCLSIQRQYIESCSKDCFSCDADTSDITLGGCLINNIQQIYGDTFCSDVNVNTCSREQIDYYERCKENCNSCNRIAADTFMNNCTIDGQRPIHSHNYCINCNSYIRGDPTSCVSMKTLDNSITCKYSPAGTEAIEASCKPINNPNVSNYSEFDGTKESCPEDQNYYFIPATPESVYSRSESCSKIINCNYFGNDPYSCVSTESNTEQCVYNYGNEFETTDLGRDCDNCPDISPPLTTSGQQVSNLKRRTNIIPFTCVNENNELYYNIESKPTTNQEKQKYYYDNGICMPKGRLMPEPQIVSTESGSLSYGPIGTYNEYNVNRLLSKFLDDNKVIFSSSKQDIVYTPCDDCTHSNVRYSSYISGLEDYTCQEIYDHTLGFCHPDFCELRPDVCPENEGYKYIFGQIDPSDSEGQSCSLTFKPT
tara:strand:+ start:2735 stop:4534 length:1800 start_codon:yes stop_codon:yes gene_type:complete